MMVDTERLRAEAGRLLSAGEVEVVVGYQRGTLPLRAAPLVARTVEDAGRLIWDQTCDTSLAVYVPRLAGKKIGLVARGCDGRWVVQHIIEHRIDRSDIKVIAVPCSGVLSPRAVERAAGHRPITGGRVDGDYVLLEGDGWDHRVAVAELIDPACASCVQRTSPLVDVDLGQTKPAVRRGSFPDVAEHEARPADDRWEEFVAEMNKCIRCYACRQACPGCYCKECFVDRTDPVQVGGTDNRSDTMAFHIMRAMHLAGRCVNCGACERACPVGVNLRVLNRKLEQDSYKLFGHIPGLSLEDKPLLSTYRPDDPEEFIL